LFSFDRLRVLERLCLRVLERLLERLTESFLDESSVAFSDDRCKLLFQFVGDPVLYIQQFILVAHVSPWRPHLQSNMVIKEALKPAFQITKFITDFQYHHGYVLINKEERKVASSVNTSKFS